MSMNLCIKELSGNVIEFPVVPYHFTVFQLIIRFVEKKGWEPKMVYSVRIIYAGKQLNPDRRLVDYSVCKGSSLVAVTRMRSPEDEPHDITVDLIFPIHWKTVTRNVKKMAKGIENESKISISLCSKKDETGREIILHVHRKNFLVNKMPFFPELRKQITKILDGCEDFEFFLKGHFPVTDRKTITVIDEKKHFGIIDFPSHHLKEWGIKRDFQLMKWIDPVVRYCCVRINKWSFKSHKYCTKRFQRIIMTLMMCCFRENSKLFVVPVEVLFIIFSFMGVEWILP